MISVCIQKEETIVPLFKNADIIKVDKVRVPFSEVVDNYGTLEKMVI